MNRPGTVIQQALYKPILYGLYVCSKLPTTGRKQTLYNNFKYLYRYTKWKGEKLYGFWRFSHVLQAKTNGVKSIPFALLLATDNTLNLSGRIAAIACLYAGVKMMLPTQFSPPFWQDAGKQYTASDKFSNDGEMLNIPLLTYFKEVTQPNTATLFQLEGSGSPFASEKIAIKYNVFMPANQQLQLDENGKI